MLASLLGGGLIESIVSSTSPDNFTAIFENQTRLTHIIDIDDQVEACRRIFVSDTRWTVVRGSDLEEGESQGLPAWSRHVGDPILASNITRRVDYALFMMEALKNDELIHEAPAIVGCQTPSALAHKVQK
jgi:hypothetical protein